MLDQKKIDAAIRRINKQEEANFVGPEPEPRLVGANSNMRAIQYLDGTLDPIIRGYVAGRSALNRCRPQTRYIVSHQQQGDVAGMQLYLGFWATCAMMWQHLARATLEKTDFVNVFADFLDLSDATSALLQAGHPDHAATFARTVYDHYAHLTRSNGTGGPAGSPFFKYDVAPFALVAGGFPENHPSFNPQAILSSPRPGYELYAQLVNIWDRPDPDEVRNTVQALRDRRVSLACMTDSQQSKLIESAEYYWLFHDPLLHAMNMRRMDLGLQPVAYETYIRGVTLPLEKVPFVIDDLLYPAYIKACGELAETPMDFGAATRVSQNPDNGMLTRI